MYYPLAALAFLSEIALWLGLGRLVYLYFDKKRPLALILGVVAVVIFITLWGIFFSPKAVYPLSKLPHTLLLVLMSLGIGYGLYRKGDKGYGLLVMVGPTLIKLLWLYFIETPLA